MGTYASSAAESSPPEKRISGRRVRLGGQDGQSLIIVTLAMFVVIGISALAIDVAQWYQKHHSAQVTADAAALAAANCLATSTSSNVGSSTCTSTNDANAQVVATTMAHDNGYTLTDSSNVQTSFDSVTVTVPTTAPALFAGIAKVTSATISARAVAHFYTGGEKFNCASSGGTNCLSFFAANPNCPATGNTTVGLDLVTQDNGAGGTSIPDAYSNGYYFNGAHSGASTFGVTVPGSNGSPSCATSSTVNKKSTTYTFTTGSVPYPAVWAYPTPAACTYTASYWTTGVAAGHQITNPGIYCVTNPDGTIATSSSQACNSSPATGTTGYVNLDETSAALTAGGTYEFVSPCTIISNSSNPSITNIPGQPLVYGTSNITVPGTSSALPTCTSAANNGTAGTDIFVTGNNGSLGSPVYDQCGTFEITQNNTFLGYVEAWNIIVDKNNSATGNGPTTPGGGGVTTLPPGDNLAG